MSAQRRFLKTLAKTPHSIFEEEDVPIIVGKVSNKSVEEVAGKKSETDIVVTDIEESSEDSISDTEYAQCKYCGEYHTDWIQCDGESCPIEWYGLDCSKVTDIPAGKWLCVLCRPRVIFPNLPGAPKLATPESSNQTAKGIAIKKRTSKPLKPGWRGYIEVSREVERKMQEEAQAHWKVDLDLKRTRTESKNGPEKRTRRLRSGNETTVRRSPSSEPAESEEGSAREDPDEDAELMHEKDVAQEPESALDSEADEQGDRIRFCKSTRRLKSRKEISVRRSPSTEVSGKGGASAPEELNEELDVDANMLDSESLTYEPETMSHIRAGGQEDDRFSTSEEMEGKVRSMADDQLAKELAASLDSVAGLNQTGTIEDKESESSDGDESLRTYRESTFEGFSDSERAEDESDVQQPSVLVDDDFETSSEQAIDELNNFSEEQDSEMTDEIESAIGEMNVVGEAEGQSDDEESAKADFGNEELRETLGVGTDDYRYLDLSPYGPFLVRSSS